METVVDVVVILEAIFLISTSAREGRSYQRCYLRPKNHMNVVPLFVLGDNVSTH